MAPQRTKYISKMNKILPGLITFSILLAIMVFSFFPASSFSVFQNQAERLMMNMKSQTLNKGRVVNIEAELYYDAFSGRLITRYTHPPGQIMITNDKGELIVFDETKNTVSFDQGEEFSTKTNLIYYFLQGKIHDLGLSDFGFQLMSTEIENDQVITEWFPPVNLFGVFNRIKIVHENFLPIYVAYYDAQENLAKRVYYSDYQNLGEVFLPALVTEINYFANDSVVGRISFSDIKTDFQAQSPWFGFQIPEDATIKR